MQVLCAHTHDCGHILHASALAHWHCSESIKLRVLSISQMVMLIEVAHVKETMMLEESQH